MLHFCTLFNQYYLSRGIAMFESLRKVCPNFTLYVFAFDSETYTYLKNLNYNNLKVISLQEFEDEQLLKVKPTRTIGEYCWTCTSSTILYVLQNFDVDNCTYIDADLFFYSNPQVLIEEMGNKSVLITEHRYTPKYDQSKLSGIYCVQFVTFKNNKDGLNVLNWWRNACLDWCYNRHEDGKFGDQKYLDDWTSRFDSVHVLKHIGGGVAPWNIQQYKLSKNDNNQIRIITKTNSTLASDLVFYHFHELKFIGNNSIDLCSYKIVKNDITLIYQPYIDQLLNCAKTIASKNSQINSNGDNIYKINWKTPLKKIKRYLIGTLNIVKY